MGQQDSPYRRYVAVGDSFTEGVGDERPDGSVRGWADLVAGRAADRYANLAIRGKLLGAIVDEQLEPAIDLHPDLVSVAGGANDVLRPRTDLAGLARLLDQVVARLVGTGARVVVFTAADPCDHLPMGRRVRAQGDVYSAAVRRIADRRGALLVDLWARIELRAAGYWSADRLHLGPAGHRYVAGVVLDRLDLPRPAEWSDPAPQLPTPTHPFLTDLGYYREHVVPWVHRRLTGRSSGDHRQAKQARLEPPPAP